MHMGKILLECVRSCVMQLEFIWYSWYDLVWLFKVFICWYTQGLGPYSNSIKKAEKEIKEMAKKINDLCGMQIYYIRN